MALDAPRRLDRRTAETDLSMEIQTLHAEREAVARYLRVVGGRIVHLVEAEYLPAARHQALEIVSLADRLERRGMSGDAA